MLLKLKFPTLTVVLKPAVLNILKEILHKSQTNEASDKPTNLISEIRKSKVLTMISISEHVFNSVVFKTLFKNSKGNIRAVSINSGEKLEERNPLFDTFFRLLIKKQKFLFAENRSFSRLNHIILSKQPGTIKSRNDVRFINNFKPK